MTCTKGKRRGRRKGYWQRNQGRKGDLSLTHSVWQRHARTRHRRHTPTEQGRRRSKTQRSPSRPAFFPTQKSHFPPLASSSSSSSFVPPPPFPSPFCVWGRRRRSRWRPDALVRRPPKKKAIIIHARRFPAFFFALPIRLARIEMGKWEREEEGGQSAAAIVSMSFFRSCLSPSC